MKLEQINIFLELAKELHFWRTSEKVFLTQSSLSRQIQALELELGFALFIRNKRTVKLTEAGQFMKDEWERLIAEIGDIHRHAKQISLGEVGTLRIGHPGSIVYSYLPELLANTSAEFPKLRFELVEITAADLDRALLNYTIDIGFNRDSPTNNKLASKLANQDNFGLFVPLDHWIRTGSTNNLKKLAVENFILPRLHRGSQYAADIESIFEACGFTPLTYIESEFGSTILSIVNRGLGISIMPSSYSRNMPENVRFVPLPYVTSLFAVWRKDDMNPVLHNLLSNNNLN